MSIRKYSLCPFNKGLYSNCKNRGGRYDDIESYITIKAAYAQKYTSKHTTAFAAQPFLQALCE